MTLSMYPKNLTEEHLQNAYPDCWDNELKQTVRLWLKDLQMGARPLTIRTIRTFRERFIRYSLTIQREFKLKKITLEQCMDLKTAYSMIGLYPVEGYSNRHNTFYAIHSLARFLIRLGEMPEDYILRLKQFRPKRVIAPKRTVLRDKGILEQLEAVITPANFPSSWRCLIAKTTLKTFVYTGLRNLELCQLALEDVDLENRVIRVRLGKGRKDRQVGICKALLPFLQAYLEERLQYRTNSSNFFITSYLTPYNPTTLGRLIQNLSRLSGVTITTHGLRRTFATLNAEEGKPLHLIQLALGHSDIRTTQEYLMSDQEAVIEAMKDW